MQRQFARWAIFTFIILGLSSAVGLVVNAVVDPHKERYQSTYQYSYSPPPPQPYYRTDLQAGPQWFSNPQPAPVFQKTMYTEAINSVLSQHAMTRAGQSYANVFPNYFHTNRMAEEWARFGVYQFRGIAVTNNEIATDAGVIHQELLNLAMKDVPAFRPSKVSIEWVTASSDGNDAMVLAKHTSKINDLAVTWYARWWLTQQYSVWKVYDVQMSDEPFRLNARIAGEKMFANDGNRDRYPRDGVANEMTSLTSRLQTMQRTGVRPVLNQKADGDFYAYIPPIDVTRLLMISDLPGASAAKGALAAELQKDAKTWDAPLSDLMLADVTLDMRWIDSFRTKAGNVPWAVALEAKILLQKGEKQKATEVLAKGLKETPGHAVILIEQYRQTPPGQRAVIGELAASGATPGESLTALCDMYFQNVADLEAMVDAYRSIRPQDATGANALATVRYCQGRFDEARKHFQAAVGGADVATYLAAKSQLAKWCALGAQEKPDVIEHQPQFQSVVKK